MHYAILNSSGNALEWFEDEADGHRVLEEMLAEFPDADLDLVAFDGPGRPAEPVSASARSAWPSARLVLSSQALAATNVGNMDVVFEAVNTTDDRVEQEA